MSPQPSKPWKLPSAIRKLVFETRVLRLALAASLTTSGSVDRCRVATKSRVLRSRSPRLAETCSATAHASWYCVA